METFALGITLGMLVGVIAEWCIHGRAADRRAERYAMQMSDADFRAARADEHERRAIARIEALTVENERLTAELDEVLDRGTPEVLPRTVGKSDPMVGALMEMLYAIPDNSLEVQVSPAFHARLRAMWDDDNPKCPIVAICGHPVRIKDDQNLCFALCRTPSADPMEAPHA